MNKFLKILFIVGLFLSLINVKPIYAIEDKYEVCNFDGTKESLLVTSSFDEAYTFYLENINNYLNICIYKNDEALFMEYGTLYIDSDEDKVSYFSLAKNKDVEISNFKEYDLLYICEEYEQVKFIIEDDIGYIDRNLVTYYPYGSRPISYYDIIDGSFYHHISSYIKDYYKYNFMLDEALPFMKDRIKYFSYDGHFFYDDFFKMSDDYYADKNDNALNKDEPYFNYYAYLPARSYTNYSADDFNTFFKENLGITGRLFEFCDFDKDGANDSLNYSELYESGKAFVSCEKIYGINALQSLALAMVESNNGKSLNAFKKSNLYNHEALSDSEIINNKYNSITSSIYSHAKNFASKYYCNLFTTYYAGSYIGDFASGLGSCYSYNPLFNEMYVDKAYFIDKCLGLKDKGEYSLGIAKKDCVLYYGPDTAISYKIFRNMKNNSFIILDKGDGYMKVQNDYSMNSTGEYNPLKSVLYIKESSIINVIDGKNNNINYKEYKVDFEDYDGSILSLYSKNDFDVENEFEYKDIDGIDIDGYVLSDNKYIPISKKIKDIKFESIKYPFIKNNEAYIKDGRINITYDDNTSKKVKIHSDNIVEVKNENKTTTIKYSYKGFIKEAILKGSYDINNNDVNSISAYSRYSKNHYSSYSFDDVRNFDNIFKRDDTISTYIRDKVFDFSIEGCNPNFIYYSSDILPTIINTYYFNIDKTIENTKLTNYLSAYNMLYVDSFDITVSRSLYNIDFVSPMMMQVKLSKTDSNCNYVVYHKEKDNSFTKLPTQFSNNYVKFLTIDDGSFYIYKINGASSYDIKDSLLNIQTKDNGSDYYGIILEGLIFITITIFGYVIIALHYIFKRKEIKPWKEFKNLLQKAESALEEKLKH